jgi:hypothetical protein
MRVVRCWRLVCAASIDVVWVYTTLAQQRAKKTLSGGRRKYVHVASGPVPDRASPRIEPFSLAAAHLLAGTVQVTRACTPRRELFRSCARTCWGIVGDRMQDRALRKVLLVQAIEETDRSGEALPLAERVEATRAVMGNNPPNVEAQAGAPLSSATEFFLVRRADVLIDALRGRSPGIDHVLAVAGGATSLDRGLLVAAFVLGAALSFFDFARGGINIFAAPLVVLVVWNLLVYVFIAVRSSQVRIESTAASAANSEALRESYVQPSGFGRFYARWVRRQVDHLLGHSTRFNAPLAPGLRRFAGQWLELAQPLFFARARRLLHLSALLAALGLVTAYYFRGFALRSAAGWEGGGNIGPEMAHVLLTVLYGPASLLSGISIPGADAMAALRWSAPSLSGVGEPAIWVHLIALTAGLYIIMPRLILTLLSALRLWRLSRRVVLPPEVAAYLQTLVATARAGT